MVRKLPMTVCVLFALGGATEQTAQAHQIGIFKKSSSFESKLKFYKMNIAHAKHEMTTFSEPKRFLFGWVRLPALTVAQAAEFSYHERLLRNARRNYKSTLARLVKWKETLLENQHYGVPTWFYNLAMCMHPNESSDWAYGAPGHPGAVSFEGGLQFVYSTWVSNGGLRFASHAYYATPNQQIAVAWRASNYGSVNEIHHQWPNTSRLCGV